MIAQLSQSEPRGRPSASSIGVSWAGSLRTKSGSSFFPQTSTSSKSSPAARTKMRAVRLFTLGVRMCSLWSAMCLLLLVVLRQRSARAVDERLDGVRQVDAVDVVVAALHADPVRLEQHLGVGHAVGWLEAVRRELDQEPERVL